MRWAAAAPGGTSRSGGWDVPRLMGAIVTAGRRRGGDTSIRSLAISPVGAGLGAGLGLGLGGLLLMPIAAGAGFAATLVLFALIVLARKG